MQYLGPTTGDKDLAPKEYVDSRVIANPTLAGTEANLTGVQIGTTKYKVPSGGGGGSALSFTVDLGWRWQNDQQTIYDANFIASGYAYVVTPSPISASKYASYGIYADNVTTDGQMTFHRSSPSSHAEFEVNILRVGVS